MSNVQCYACGVYGHIQTEEKCKKEDIERWKNQKRSGNHEQKKTTANHMTAESSEEYDSDDDYYRVMMCTSHEEAHVGSVPRTKGQDEIPRNPANNIGHIVDESVHKVESVITHSFNRKRGYVIPKGIVGFYSMSTVDVFSEKLLLTNIRTVKTKMKIVCNAGVVVVTQM